MPELSPKHNFDISVRYLNGELAFRATQREYVVLRGARYVEPVEYKHEFGYARLLVPIRVARRLIGPLQIKSSSHVSKCKQDKGAKRWIQRLDRADMGRTASLSAMLFGVAPSLAEVVPGLNRVFSRSVVNR